MKFVISTANIKTFAKSILALFKVGDEVYVEPLQESLTMRTVNSSRSAFACFSFKKSFFTHFEPELSSRSSKSFNKTGNSSRFNKTTNDDDDMDAEDSQLEEVEPFRCKIPAKCLFSIFKNINSLEKNVEKCTITVKYIPLSQETASRVYEFDTTMTAKRMNEKNEEQLFDIKFLIILSCKHNIRKTFILSISDCENLQAAFSIKNCSNKLNISAKYLNETINCFSNEIEEVTFVVEANKLSIKNYEAQNIENNSSSVNTLVSFDSDEFSLYEIEKETDITFCLKEFKIGLQFGFYFDLPLDIYFQRKGRPIIFCYHNNSSYEATFTLATLSEDYSTTQSTSLLSSSSTTSSSNPNNASLVKYTSNENNENNSNKNKIANTKEKNNKRSLIDASNHVYLDDSLNEKTKKKVYIKESDNEDEDEDEDDALLTQALNEQEAKNKTIQASPPSKKMKSLVQTIFGDDEEQEEEEEDQTDNDVTMRDENTTKTKRISFASCLNTTTTNGNKQDQEVSKQHTSIYIEETSSEEED